MVKPTADQIYTLDLSEDDNVVHYDQDAQGTGFLDAVGEIVTTHCHIFAEFPHTVGRKRIIERNERA